MAKHKPMPANPTGKLVQSARARELVAVIVSGVSIALTNNQLPELSWSD